MKPTVWPEETTHLLTQQAELREAPVHRPRKRAEPNLNDKDL